MTHQAVTTEAENPTLKKKKPLHLSALSMCSLQRPMFTATVFGTLLWGLGMKLHTVAHLELMCWWETSHILWWPLLSYYMTLLPPPPLFPPPPLMSSGYGWRGVQIFPFTATSPAGCSHGAPNASPEYWMKLRTTSTLPDQQWYCYLAIALQVVSWLWQDGWALNLLLWVQAEILGMGGCLKSVWWCPTCLSNLPF